MSKIFSCDTLPANDAEFKSFLKKFDPITPPGEGFLSALEADIFARVASVPQVSVFLPNIWVFGGPVKQRWAARAAGIVALLLVMLGISAGHALYGAVDAHSGVSLVAYVDESSWQSVLALHMPWGENYDYAE
jgi:hypothetical protein